MARVLFFRLDEALGSPIRDFHLFQYRTFCEGLAVVIY
jgi:hypothetical protein